MLKIVRNKCVFNDLRVAFILWNYIMTWQHFLTFFWKTFFDDIFLTNIFWWQKLNLLNGMMIAAVSKNRSVKYSRLFLKCHKYKKDRRTKRTSMSVSVTIKIIWHTYIKKGVVVRSLPKEKKGTYDDILHKKKARQ